MSSNNQLRKVLCKNNTISWATRHAAPAQAASQASAVQAQAQAKANNELTIKWLNRLRQTANSNVSREQHSQLSSVLDYYNRQSSGTAGMQEIDWAGFEQNIHTPGVVGKIKAKYQQFMASEFQVDGAVSRCGVRSEQMKQLDVSMQYNYHLWFAHYLLHLEQIETLHNIGDPTQLGVMEMQELFPESETLVAGNTEIGNLAPQDFVENSQVVRISTQFSWGSRYCPPFVHSNNSTSSIVATLAKLGK